MVAVYYILFSYKYEYPVACQRKTDGRVEEHMFNNREMRYNETSNIQIEEGTICDVHLTLT